MKWKRGEFKSQLEAQVGNYLFVVSKEEQLDKRDPWCATMYEGDRYGNIVEEECYIRRSRDAQELCSFWLEDYAI